MGGTVRAESPVSDDGGSRFVVTLRQWQAAAPLPSRPDGALRQGSGGRWPSLEGRSGGGPEARS